MNASELREMSPEQLELTLQETAKNLFRLRMQAQTERLSTPSELRSHRKTVARIKTIQRERQAAEASAAGVSA
jgi:large subunit ribosomal protein L29